SIRKVLLNSFAFLYFSMQIYSQQASVWVGFLACCCPADSKSERSQNFIVSNTSKYVKVLNFKTKIANFSAKSSYLRIVGNVLTNLR
ncbi:hypothetical protein, partial [Emticicia oligotrophica]|uniref:hypothetical protein n=1 Tax=Emticicia oligotrophica TaxID=312279 RepID=UPI00273B4FF9